MKTQKANQEVSPCPFCGATPTVGPEDPKTEGDAWASVVCINKKCPTNPEVTIYEDSLIDDDLSGEWLDTPEKIKAEAIRRWNRRKN